MKAANGAASAGTKRSRYAADGLRRARDSGGADAVGVLASARQTNEENYLTQKFARIVAGTNNVDCCARVCHMPSATALKGMLGSGLSTNSFDDIEHAGAILVFGANATENHPIVGARIKQAARRRGAALIVVDPRRIELAEYAECHLAVHPGANIPLLNAMAHVIVAEHLVDRTFIDNRVSGYDAFAQSVKEWPPERVADICGVDADAIRKAARLYATTKPAMIVTGLGATEYVQGTDGVSALVNLALLTGNVGKPGSGVNALRGQNNVQGAAHMGCEPATLPGGASLEKARGEFERLWQAPIPHARGLTEMEMFDAAVGGDLKALWVIGYDVLLSNPNARETAHALEALDVVIIQDLFMSETARQFGSVFLPACSLKKAMDTVGYAKFRAEQKVKQEAFKRGETRDLMGIGVAFFTEIVGAGPSKNCDILGIAMFDSAEIRIHPTGCGDRAPRHQVAGPGRTRPPTPRSSPPSSACRPTTSRSRRATPTPRPTASAPTARARRRSPAPPPPWRRARSGQGADDRGLTSRGARRTTSSGTSTASGQGRPRALQDHEGARLGRLQPACPRASSRASRRSATTTRRT